MSVEMGYYLNKTQTGKRDEITGVPIEKFSTHGLADLILFPKYDVYNHSDSTKRIEFTVGMGYKIPIGKYSDSSVVFHNPNTGKDVYTIMPPIVQATNGSQDIIFYAFFMRGFPKHNFRLFTNATYIKKGWNPLGFKFGDYAGLGLFAGKSFFKNFAATLQLKGEWIDAMHYNENIDMVALYNIYVGSTGSKKISLVPQLNYNYKKITLYALADLPLYEYVNGSQMKTKLLVTTGISYRFFTTKNPICEIPGTAIYECPMKCEGKTYAAPGKCESCGMDLIKKQ